jgi:hypothetical protein
MNPFYEWLKSWFSFLLRLPWTTTVVRLLNEPTNELSFITRGEPTRDHHLQHFVSYILCIRCYGYVFLASRCLAMDYSGFQASWHTRHGKVLSEPLSSNGLFRLSGVMSQYACLLTSLLCGSLRTLTYLTTDAHSFLLHNRKGTCLYLQLI